MKTPFYLNLNKYPHSFTDWLMSNDDVDCLWDEDGFMIFNNVDTKELYKQFKSS